ncbi:hypothetical protein [Nocardia sp. NPDC052566]|uniref:hypothetical protein n=1 Tax=Nocardia sp. NPDC052566 TaxID=3364330 RepID=UPI0037C55BD3
MSEAMRVLVPDHPDLTGQLGRAIEFAAALRHANDIDDTDGEEPWRLPDQLVAPELQAALEAIVLHDWRFDVGSDTARTEIGLTHADVEHMGLYIATATRAQLSLLRAALDTITQAETTPLAQRGPEQREIAHFAEVWSEVDEHDDYDASLSAWRTVVQILTLAISTAPAGAGERPSRLYNAEGFLLPAADVAGSTPAGDTVVVLDRIDSDQGRSVDLDNAAWRAWQRLSVEWHAAVYGARSNDPDARLSSFAY